MLLPNGGASHSGRHDMSGTEQLLCTIYQYDYDYAYRSVKS
jgi:hypothetical protein